MYRVQQKEHAWALTQKKNGVDNAQRAKKIRCQIRFKDAPTKLLERAIYYRLTQITENKIEHNEK